MSQRPPRTGRPADAPFVLEVKRFKEGEARYVRTLSKAIDGLAYHWHKKRGHYCNPKGCSPEVHKIKPDWKGYFAGEWYEERLKLWIPAAVEVTSALELDFRHEYQRGQVWWIERLQPTKDTHPPMTARLIETLDAATLPAAFDFLPTLCTMYGTTVVLGVKNWAPDRVIVTPSRDAAPGPIAAAEKADTPPTEEQWAKLREITGRDPRKPVGANGSNGKH
jgi:hypothetical protein